MRRSVALALLLAAGLALTQPVAWIVALDGPTAHAAELEIDVTGPAGLPPAKGTAAFLPYGIDSAMGRREAPLDAGGRCVLWPRPGDSGVVLVQADGFRTWWSYDVQVAPGRQRLRVELDEGLAVSGLVLGRDGATPVADASVRVTEHALRGLAPNLAERKTRTDGEGRFRVEGLSPGRVDIRVASDDGSGRRRPMPGTATYAYGRPERSASACCRSTRRRASGLRPSRSRSSRPGTGSCGRAGSVPGTGCRPQRNGRPFRAGVSPSGATSRRASA